MALSGTLNDFALDEVLVFVGKAGKSGLLTVEDDSRQGLLWIDVGQVTAASFADGEDPVDVAFELMRLGRGSFTFDQSKPPADGKGRRPVDDVLTDARTRLAEWRDIERVVPSLVALVALNPTAPEPEVVVDRDQWATICAIASGGPVGQVAERLGVREFAACKAVKSVVDAGLAAVAPASGEGRHLTPVPGAA
ncbi:MAG TPA: DUF4388 domain-containing protein [Acidimicrobiales bacterium]|nr:DUF4388 domain-containing protein [Acidimicrobiales bacterium]